MKTMTKPEIKGALRDCMRWFDIMPLGAENGVADAAKLIGKSARTIEAYLAPSNDRVISAADLMTLSIAATRKIASWPKQPRMPISVYDRFGKVTATSHSVVYATFIADVECGYWEFDPHQFVVNKDMNSVDEMRSKLRKMIYSGVITTDEACKELDCDEYTLILYQAVWPFTRVLIPQRDDVQALEELAHYRTTGKTWVA